jgi:hypothetical protein
MENIFNVHTQNSILAITSGGSDDVGTVSTTTKTNSHSSYSVTLFNDIELDSSTGETDLETLRDHIKSHKDIFDDDDWI